jgi:two-component system, chemotaxis family, chemotaxis protein CheY
LSAQILIVDDDAGSRNALTNLLRDEGFRVEAVAGGTDAMAYLRGSPAPKLIVLDLMMPDMDGWDFRHEQKRDAKLAGIPVIAVSAAGKLPDADEQFRKPLDFEKFLDTVKRYVRPASRR